MVNVVSSSKFLPLLAFFPPSFPLGWAPIQKPPADQLSLWLSQLPAGSAKVLAVLWHIWLCGGLSAQRLGFKAWEGKTSK